MRLQGTQRTTRSARRLTLAALLGVLVVGVWGAYAVFAASAPAAPTLTATPANPTNSTSATFSYSDSQSGVTFSCTLDSVAKTCPGSTSGGATIGSATFTVSAGAHTFSIAAVSGSKTSSATTYTWTVDTTPPTASAPALASASPTGVSSVSWTVTFSEAVKNVVVGNLSLTASNLTGASITGLTGSGASYTVTASTGSLTTAGSDGSLRLNLANKGSGSTAIMDLAGNPLSTAVPLTGAGYTIDRTPPPAPAISGGPSGTVNQTSATFNLADTESGAAFLCKLDAGSYAACSSPATFTGLADGSHTLTVEAKDAAGNVSSPSGTRTWTVDTAPPPSPSVTGPNNNNPSTAATFTFSDSEANVTFKCRLDGSAYTTCASPKTYTLLTPGTHIFDVEPFDQAGNLGPYNEWKWTISGSSGSGQPFTISNPVLASLYPGGGTDDLDLALTNPNSATIYVSALTITFSVTAPNASGAHPCTTSDFQLKQYGGTYPIVLGAGQTKTLSQLGVGAADRPSIKMPDTHLNQDGCKGAALHFTYTGSAQS